MSGFGDFLKTAIGPIADIAGSLIGAHQSDKAADAVVDANKDATALQREIYERSYADSSPYRAAGVAALGRLTGNMTPEEQKALENVTAKLGYNPLEGRGQYGAFYASPDYNFRFDEGNRALDHSAAARGMLLSGARQKAGIRYGGEAAGEEYNNWFNRNASLAGIGQTADNRNAILGANYGSQAGNNMTNAADARASGYLGIGNSIAGGIQNYADRTAFEKAMRDNEMRKWYGYPT